MQTVPGISTVLFSKKVRRFKYQGKSEIVKKPHTSVLDCCLNMMNMPMGFIEKMLQFN